MLNTVKNVLADVSNVRPSVNAEFSDTYQSCRPVLSHEELQAKKEHIVKMRKPQISEKYNYKAKRTFDCNCDSSWEYKKRTPGLLWGCKFHW